MSRSIVLAALGLLIGIGIGLRLGRAGTASAGLPTPPVVQPASDTANAELLGLCVEDQADRTPRADGTLPTEAEFQQIGVRDQARLNRVRAIYLAGGVQTPRDHMCAATILQHSYLPAVRVDDHLLAHEFAIVAFVHGIDDAGYLVAASEDRLLQDDLGRRQRFGTQFGGDEDLRVSGAVTDALRRQFGVPTLQELRNRGRPAPDSASPADSGH